MADINLENIENIVNELVQDNVIEKVSGQVSEFVPHTIDDYNKIEDSFIRYRVMVNDALNMYNQACSIAAVSDTGKSASIHRMSEPFRKGFFTLAVVGKMSAGKSTFINALLGDNNLLPTGHFQTTCTLTTIQHSDQKKLKVIYGDDREEAYVTNIYETLQELVAIPERYKDLPVNNVNRLILYGKNIEEICGEELVKEMEALSRNTINIDNLREYVESHPIGKIPKVVAIECPLNENYQGWRIVDTPGVDAIGGIEDDTKQFLCGSDAEGNHNVDAIIFIQAAQASIADLHLNEFVSETINSLTDEAKKRTFFVLTHGTDPAFLRNKEGIMEEAKRLFVDYGKVGIAGERLIVVDSIASLMKNDMSLDLETLTFDGQPKNWDEKEWGVCRDLLGQIDIMLRRMKTEVNNENLRRLLSKLANFDGLRNMLDAFVREEKRTSFDIIISDIEEDIAHCISIREKDISILQRKLGKEPEEFREDLENEKAKLDDFQLRTNEKMREIRNIYSKTEVRAMFDREILEGVTVETFSQLSSINLMRRKAEEAGSKARALEKSIIEEIRKIVKSFVDTSLLDLNIALPALDIQQIEHDAKVESTTYEDVIHRGEKKKGFWGGVKRLFGNIFDTDWGYETWIEKVEHLDEDNMLMLAAKGIFGELKTVLGEFRDKVIQELEKIADRVGTQIAKDLANRKASYDKLAEGTDTAEQIDAKRAEIVALQDIINNLEVFKRPN